MHNPLHSVFLSLHSCSYIGNVMCGEQGVSLSRNGFTFPVVVHEIGHAIGFWHEHNRPDRDRYIRVLYNNIQTGIHIDCMTMSLMLPL